MKKYKFMLFFITLISFSLINEVRAEKKQVSEKKSPSAESSVQDFSKGFAKFEKFGLPNVKDAEYIKVDLYSSAIYCSEIFSYQAKIEGNAWLLSENKKSGKADIVLNQGAVATVYDQVKLLNEMAKKRAEEAKKHKKKNIKSGIVNISFTDMNDDKLVGGWKKANLKKDVERLIKYLRKEMQKEHFWGRDSLGSCFLFAAHLNQKGMKKEANELASLLFEAGKGKRIVILQALNTLADAKYDVAYANFKEDHDWEKFAENIKNILNLYKSGWKKSPGVKILAERLANRKVDIENLKKLKVSKENLELINKILSGKVGKLSKGNWIFNTPRKTKTEAEVGDIDEPSPVSKIIRKGMDAVPFLIKLLGNQTLIPADKNDLTRGRSGFVSHSYSSSQQQSAEQIFMKLKRPMTLGEFAKSLLEPIVLQDEDSNSDLDEIVQESTDDEINDFRKLCQKWYKENKGKSAVELAEEYLHDGSRKQKSRAVSYLLNHKVKSKYNLIEDFLLDENERSGSWSDSRFMDKLAIRYAGMRGKEAKAFAEKYIAILDPDGILRKEAQEKKSKKKTKEKKNKDSSDDPFSDSLDNTFSDNVSDNDGLSKWEKKQILNKIEKLKGLTSDESIEDVFNNLLSGKKVLTPNLKIILTERLNMSDKAVDEKLAFILNNALSALEKKRMKLFTSFMDMAVRCSSQNYISSYNSFSINFDDDENNNREKPDPTKNKDLWKKLLENSSLVGEFKEAPPTTIGQSVPEYYDAVYKCKNSFFSLGIGDQIKEFARLRILKKLTGVPDDKLPKIPVIKDLSEKERDTKIKSVIKKVKDAQDKKKCVNSLSLEELILLQLGLDKDNKLNIELAKIANQITKVETSMSGAKKFKKFAGKPLSEAMIEELRLFAFNALKEGKKIYCRIYRGSALDGISIFINEIPEDKVFAELKNKDAKILLSGLLKVPGAFNIRAYWPLTKEVKEKTSEKDVAKDEEDELFRDMEEEIIDESKDFYSKKQASFQEKIKLFAEGKFNALFAGGVYFQGAVE